MGFGGHVADMISRMNNNRLMRNKHGRMHKRLQENRFEKVSYESIQERKRKSIKLSDKERNHYRLQGKKFAEGVKRQKLISYLFVLALLVATVLLIVLFQ